MKTSTLGAAAGRGAAVVFVAVAAEVAVSAVVGAAVAARVEVAVGPGKVVGNTRLVAAGSTTVVGAAAVVAVARGTGVWVAAAEAVLGVTEAGSAVQGATDGVDVVLHAASIRTAIPSRDSRVEKVQFMPNLSDANWGDVLPPDAGYSAETSYATEAPYCCV
jgi:hypothetical protein